MVCLAALAPAGACTLLVDASPDQCHSDGDCARFPGAVCDAVHRVCVAGAASIDAAPLGDNTDGGGADAGRIGALICAADGGTAPEVDFLNACTNAACVPFDNHGRLHNLQPDGTLKPLPDLDGGQD